MVAEAVVVCDPSALQIYFERQTLPTEMAGSALKMPAKPRKHTHTAQIDGALPHGFVVRRSWIGLMDLAALD